MTKPGKVVTHFTETSSDGEQIVEHNGTNQFI